MIVQTVVSENRGNEGYWIAFLCALIFILGALLLPFNSANHQHQSLASYQVSVTELMPPPLAIISELRLAHEEIRYLYDTNGTWLSVQQLEEQWIAPFVKDKSWTHQGQHHWSLVAPGIYQSEPAITGTRYLLNSLQKHVDIWLQLDSKASLPSSVDSQALIDSGWTQVVFNETNNEEQHQH